MKRALSIGLLLSLGLACGREAAAFRLAARGVEEFQASPNVTDHHAQDYEVTGRVVGVHDGDTITVLDADRTQHKIRFLGMDAPELKQAFGRASKQHLSDGCFGREVVVKVRHKDRYGRELGQVFAQGRDLNLEQVRAGLAWHYKAFSKEQAPEDRRTYAEAEEAAQQAQKGLWAEASPTPPWDYRRAGKLEAQR